eukprot:SAG31_NODE_1849_length_7088_cov_2.647446_6_plen_75_part_00
MQIVAIVCGLNREVRTASLFGTWLSGLDERRLPCGRTRSLVLWSVVFAILLDTFAACVARHDAQRESDSATQTA